MYPSTPADSDRIAAIPMIPIDPANEVRSVRAYFVRRLLKLKDNAVRNDIDDFPMF